MLKHTLIRHLAVALPLLGSAILLFSCKASQPEVAESQEEQLSENMMTEYSENLSIVMSENGLKSYHFETPLMEGYTLARDPYREFRKGIKITMFEEDSTSSDAATLTANYAIFYENRKLWEAKGDVVVIQSNGRRLYTQQLFWNQFTHRIYSNVDSRIVDGDEMTDCEGFESDEEMEQWKYRKLKGVTYFTMDEDGSKADSTKQERPESERPKAAPAPKPAPRKAPQTPQNRSANKIPIAPAVRERSNARKSEQVKLEPIQQSALSTEMHE